MPSPLNNVYSEDRAARGSGGAKKRRGLSLIRAPGTCRRGISPKWVWCPRNSRPTRYGEPGPPGKPGCTGPLAYWLWGWYRNPGAAGRAFPRTDLLT